MATHVLLYLFSALQCFSVSDNLNISMIDTIKLALPAVSSIISAQERDSLFSNYVVAWVLDHFHLCDQQFIRDVRATEIFLTM